MNGKRNIRIKKKFKNTAQPQSKKTFFFYFRALVCIVIVAFAVVLKSIDAPVVGKISQTISEGLWLDEAVEVISRVAGGEYDVVEVFGIKEKKKEADDAPGESAVTHDFYIEENTKELEEELRQEREKKAAEAKRISIEELSFTMSAEELSDDTKAEPFRIPPPSYCSYSKENINFKYKAPLYGVITSRFGYRDHPIIEDASFHTGLDIAAKAGSTITAFADGKVLETGRNATYGNYLIIDHGSGITSFYGHNSKVTVKKGQKVTLGKKVAEVGSTGMSTGPHLHFEVRKNNIRINPEHYISPETM